MKRTSSSVSFGRLITFSVMFFAFSLLGVSTISAQTYINGDQAVEVLKQEIEDLHDRGFNAYNSGNHQLVYDMGYQYRYALEILEKIQAGMSVANAVETSLPVVPFILGNLETGQTFADSNLEARQAALRAYARNLLIQ